MNDILPNRLKSGTKLVTARGQKMTACKTREKNEYGEPLYRMRYESGVKGHDLWSRDDLQESGVRMES